MEKEIFQSFFMFYVADIWHETFGKIRRQKAIFSLQIYSFAWQCLLRTFQSLKKALRHWYKHQSSFVNTFYAVNRISVQTILCYLDYFSRILSFFLRIDNLWTTTEIACIIYLRLSSLLLTGVGSIVCGKNNRLSFLSRSNRNWKFRLAVMFVSSLLRTEEVILIYRRLCTYFDGPTTKALRVMKWGPGNYASKLFFWQCNVSDSFVGQTVAKDQMTVVCCTAASRRSFSKFVLIFRQQKLSITIKEVRFIWDKVIRFEKYFLQVFFSQY